MPTIEEAYEDYLKVYDLGENPVHYSREGQTPIGLKASHFQTLIRRIM